ncbi:hypothetical protein [Oceaniglobus trochenteri]|uniref:hypothetical protein n=1 Tax=Oceaniglobus trochenteri TaxID=2763260 RepID=UPI001D0013E7|nr:hypothetical protein [Oceaniglobus trochenteri]
MKTAPFAKFAPRATAPAGNALAGLTMAVAFLFAATPGLAADPGGRVSGMIDGETVELSVLPSQSDYGNMHISLYVVGPGLTQRGLGAMTLGAEWIGTFDGTFAAGDVSISIPAGDPPRVYRADLDDGLALSVTRSAIVEGKLEISVRAEGVLVSMDRMGLRNPDPDDTLAIDLTFDAIVE